MTTVTPHAPGAQGSPSAVRETLGSRLRARQRARQEGRPRWERPAFWALLVVAAALYLWSLGSSGYANSFYSAAAQAGGADGKAFLFGSLDAGNAITVDKPPAALWPMGIAVRLFGLGSWQILVPQALMGVASVGVLFAAVRRRVGPAGGLLAGGLLALTPVAALMFRFNNPDALLCLLMVCALYFVERAMEDARTRWLVLAGACFGSAFLVKTLQAWLILPLVAVVYLVCGPTSLRRRLGQLLLGGVSTVVTAGWWVALVELWPASSRPYIGGSQSNSFLELTFGYNGFGRITGDETGSVGGGGGPGGGGGGGWGETGLARLFGGEIGGQISWLLPAALLLLVAGLVLTRKAARTDTQRASLLLWGGSLVFTGVVFSLMSGIFHPYYTIGLAPYLAATVALGAVLAWRARDRMWCVLLLAVAVAASAAWSYVLLGRSADWFPWLRWAILVVGALAVLGLLATRWLPRQVVGAVAITGLVAAVAGPAAYTFNTVVTPHTGSIVSAGPSVQGGMGGPGGGGPPGGGGKGGPGGGQGPGGQQGGGKGNAPGGAQQGGGAGQGQPPQGGQGGPPGNGQGGNGQAGKGNGNGSANGKASNGQTSKGTAGNGKAGNGKTGNGKAGNGANGKAQAGKGGNSRARQGGPGGGRGGGPGGGGGMGGLLNGTSVSAKAKALLEKDAAQYTWVAAASGSQSAASYQLSTEEPVMAIGGFNGTDPSPTLAQFQQYVEDGKVHYFVGGSSGGPGGGKGSSSKISTWVQKNFTKVTVGNTTLYDLTKEK